MPAPTAGLHAIGGVKGLKAFLGCSVTRIVDESRLIDERRRADERLAAGIDRARPLAHAAGDAVAEQFILGQFLWILQILQHIHLAVLTGLDGIVVNEVGFETANLFEHRIDVGDQDRA